MNVAIRRTLRSRSGVTLSELLVAMSTGLILIAGMTSLFIMLQRSAARDQNLGMLRGDLHVATERLAGWIRNADGIEQASTASRLLVSGGQSIDLCGESVCWIEVGENGLVMGAQGEDDPISTIARTVTALTISFGLDDDGDGSVDAFDDEIPAGRAADVLAATIALTLHAGSGPSEYEADEQFTVVLRSPVFERLALAN